MPAIRSIKREGRTTSTSNGRQGGAAHVDDALDRWKELFDRILTHPRYREGDFTLTASDKTIFKIDKYYIMAASPRLCASGDSVSFPAGDNIDSSTLATFLDYARNQPLKKVTANNIVELCKVLRFSVKWDCAGVRRHILGDILRSTHSDMGMSPSTLFAIAGEFDDVELARHAIAGGGGWKWPTPAGFDAKPQRLRERYGHACMDPRTWSLEMFDRISPLYMCAYQRALLPYDASKMYGSAWQDVADRFEEFLELAREGRLRHS